MTNDEAILVLKNIVWFGKIYDQEQMKEAVDMAINALTAQPETHEERTETHTCDCIERQAAIDAVRRSEALDRAFGYVHAVDALRELPSAEPEIVQCRKCKFASGDSRICMKFGHSPIGELDFCSWAERRTDG